MISIFKLHWTSMNQPVNNKAYYWELGVIFDFHQPAKTKEGIQAIRLNTELNDLEKDTKFIVTDISDRSSMVKNSNRCKFEIKANVYKDGVVEEKCIYIGYGSAPCHEACWLEKVDEWQTKNKLIKVTQGAHKTFYVSANGEVC